jgi:hypothetical protein
LQQLQDQAVDNHNHISDGIGVESALSSMKLVGIASAGVPGAANRIKRRRPGHPANLQGQALNVLHGRAEELAAVIRFILGEVGGGSSTKASFSVDYPNMIAVNSAEFMFDVQARTKIVVISGKCTPAMLTVFSLYRT